MNVKKIVKKALIALFTALAICLFFANTITYILSPKITTVTPLPGNIAHNASFTGTFIWPDERKIFLYDAQKYPIIISEVLISPGQRVEAGDLMFTARISGDYHTDYRALEIALEDLYIELAGAETDEVRIPAIKREIKYREEALEALEAVHNGLVEYRARISGVVTQIHVEADALYTGQEPAFHISEQLTPVLSCLIDEEASYLLLKDIPMTIIFDRKKYGGTILRMERQFGYTAVIALDTDLIEGWEAIDLIGHTAEITLTWENGPFDTVLPRTAVSQESGRDVVYLVDTVRGYFSDELYLRSIEVTVLDANDFSVGIKDRFSKTDRIANQWDRPVKDQMRVMLMR